MDTIHLIALMNEAYKYNIKYVIPKFDAENHRVIMISIRDQKGNEEIFKDDGDIYTNVRSYLLKQ